MVDGIRNWKNHILVLILVIGAEYIGIHSFKVGIGTIVLLPMLYALAAGALLGPKFLKLVKQKDMVEAGSLIGVTLMLLMARYGTLVGPNLPMILKTSPALILQEFGNLGTVLIGIPVAVFLGLKREAIGAAHSVVFGGFSPDSLLDRINDAECKVVITGDGGFRRGGGPRC